METPVSVAGVRVSGLASAVPATIARNADLAGRYGAAIEKIIEVTGVRTRRVARRLCTSDLCVAAAQRLFTEGKVDPQSIDVVIFLSQTADYVLPATSCLMQTRLGLRTTCAAFDMSLGCSGYVYGLWVASSLLAAGGAQRVLLLVGDTTSRMISPDDRSVVLLFGDAGTATILEKDGSAPAITFLLGSDGMGAKNLIVPAGGARNPLTDQSRVRTIREGDNSRSDADLYMNGSEIFSFSMAAVPKMLKSALGASGRSLEQIDAFVFHQASKFILDHLRKRLGLPQDKVVNGLERFGNTSSASVPLAITTNLRERVSGGAMELACSAFGVGYSWGTAILTLQRIVAPALIEVEEPEDVG